MRYQFDINRVDLVNLNGQDMRQAYVEGNNGLPLEKIIGNMVYENTSDIDMEDIARAIHKGLPVELSDREHKLFVEVIGNINIVFLKRQILKQLVEVK